MVSGAGICATHHNSAVGAAGSCDAAVAATCALLAKAPHIFRVFEGHVLFCVVFYFFGFVAIAALRSREKADAPRHLQRRS